MQVLRIELLSFSFSRRMLMATQHVCIKTYHRVILIWLQFRYGKSSVFFFCSIKTIICLQWKEKSCSCLYSSNDYLLCSIYNYICLIDDFESLVLVMIYFSCIIELLPLTYFEHNYYHLIQRMYPNNFYLSWRAFFYSISGRTTLTCMFENATWKA